MRTSEWNKSNRHLTESIVQTAAIRSFAMKALHQVMAVGITMAHFVALCVGKNSTRPGQNAYKTRFDVLETPMSSCIEWRGRGVGRALMCSFIDLTASATAILNLLRLTDRQRAPFSPQSDGKSSRNRQPSCRRPPALILRRRHLLVGPRRPKHRREPSCVQGWDQDEKV